MTKRKEDKKQVKSNEKIYTVPNALEEVKSDLIFYTNSSPKTTKEQIINQAFKFHGQGNISKAAKYYEDFINQGFKDHRVFSNYGSILKNLGKLKKAEVLLRKAIEIQPDYANAYSNLGNILRELGKLKEAEILTRKAIELKPDFVDAYFNLGNILKEFGKLQEAEISTRKAIELKPDFANGYHSLGVILISLGNPYEAEMAFREAFKYKSNFLDSIYNLATTLISIRKNDEGKRYLEKIINIESNKDINIEKFDLDNLQQKSKKKLAHCLFHEGDFKSTLDLLNKISDKDFSTSYRLGCLLGLNKIKSFKNEYKIILKRNLCNSLIGSVVDHANIIYDKKIDSAFCNGAINHIIHKNLNEIELPNRICESLISLININTSKEKVRNGFNNISKTTGNIFSLNYSFIEELKVLLENQINNYRISFKDSEEGFIKNWPKNYQLGGWLLNTKAGGLLKPHMHEGSWLSGSFYLKVPKVDNNEGSIVFNPKGPLYPKKGKVFPEKILKVVSRDLCLFPSSLFHYTLPFNSSDDRICLVFDVMPVI